MTCPFGKMFIPKGGIINPSGLFIAINSIYHYAFIHSQDVYLESGDYFKTITEEIEESIIPKQFTIYFTSPFVINNIIHVIIKNKNTKTILAEKYIGQINTTTTISTIELSTSNIHNLNNDHIILEIHSINAQETDPCCDKLPSNIIINDTVRPFGGARFLCVPLEQYYELPTTTTTTTTAPFIIDFLTHPTNQNVNLNANTTLSFSAISANDIDYKYWIEYSSNNGTSWSKLSRPRYGKSRQVYSNIIKASSEKNGYKYRVIISSPTLKISNVAILSIIFPTTTTTTPEPCVAVTTTTTTTTTASPGGEGFIVSGAGSSEFNGTYCQSGTNNGKPRYIFSEYVLEYTNDFVPAGFSAGPAWIIRPVGESSEYYYILSTAQTPPLTGWSIYFGSEPAPTLSSTTCVYYTYYIQSETEIEKDIDL